MGDDGLPRDNIHIRKVEIDPNTADGSVDDKLASEAEELKVGELVILEPLRENAYLETGILLPNMFQSGRVELAFDSPIYWTQLVMSKVVNGRVIIGVPRVRAYMQDFFGQELKLTLSQTQMCALYIFCDSELPKDTFRSDLLGLVEIPTGDPVPQQNASIKKVPASKQASTGIGIALVRDVINNCGPQTELNCRFIEAYIRTLFAEHLLEVLGPK